MSETIFSKIIRGEVPAHRVYEDEHVLAFLDVAPLSPGHTLVIPKESARTVDEMSDEAAAALGRALPKICRAIKQVTGCHAYNILQNNEQLAHQAVFHVHFHIIPKPDSEKGLGIRWPSQKLDQAAAATLAGELSQAISVG